MPSRRRNRARSSLAPSGSDREGPVRLDGHGLADDEIELGYVSGVFGVAGEVKLFLHNPASGTLDDGLEVVLIRPDGTRFADALRARSGAGKRVIGRFRGVRTREIAQAMKDWVVAVRRDALPPPDEDEFYVWELEGLAVELGGSMIGEVAGVHHTAGGDLLEVRAAGETHFVPLVARWVVRVDLDGGRVVLADDALLETG
jgi:16S rRNA processing protein RimM